MERLQKFIAAAGVASRREAEKLILAGRVTVNSIVVLQLGTKIDPEKDRITVDGKEISKEENKVYLLLNKPGGYLTTVSDEQGRKTVMDLITDVKYRIYPVGRLDADTEGLLLLTNDGDLSYRLTHPRFGVSKVYRVIFHGKITNQFLESWRTGILLEDGWTAPAEVELQYARDDLSEIIVTIKEGRNRQIRRMAKASGHHIFYLERIRYAFLSLEGVKRGHYRILTKDEINHLKTVVNIT